MRLRVPAGLIRLIIRLALKPFIRPPFGFGFQRAWVRLTANVNALDRRASRTSLEIEGMPAMRASPAGEEPQRAVLYVHGGGYCWGGWKTHASLITHLAVASDTVVYAPNYRLAPEHPHPAALEDALAAYQWLLERVASPQALSIVGDSAGAGLALATAVAIRDRGLPLPASLALISPWVDLSGDSRSMRENVRVDPMLSPGGTRRCSAAYRGARDPADPCLLYTSDAADDSVYV